MVYIALARDLAMDLLATHAAGDTILRQPDVIVVGTGNAALVAALAAHEHGASVLVVESASKALRGGNSRFSGGIFRFAHQGMESLAPLLNADAKRGARHVEVGPYPTEQYYRDVMAAGQGRPDPELVELLVSKSLETMEWMRDRGVRWELTVGKIIDPDRVSADETYVLPPGGAVRSEGEGVGLVHQLFAAVASAGIEVWYDAPAVSLNLEGSTVRGLRIRRSDRYVDVAGRVILACGGFESNPEMRLRYLGPGWDLVKVRGTKFNMGTMMNFVLSVGGKPAGHWGGCHAVPIDRDAPPVGELRLTDKMSRYSYPFGILVNKDGKRFIDEGEDEVWLTYAKTGQAVLAQPGNIAFEVFDQRTLHLLEPRYSTATPVEATTIRDLAVALGIDPDILESTVNTYNAAVDGTGKFDPFRKDGLATASELRPRKSNWALPIDSAPFVAYAVTCGITFTYGGLSVDRRARVLDTEDRPMPGLYAAGEITGGFFFHNYPAGSGLMRGAVLGRIAGAEAALQSG